MKFRSIILGATLLASAASASAAWHVAESRHFVIYSDEDPQGLRDFAEKLEKFDAAVRLLRNAEDPPIGDALRLTVYVLGTTNQVSKLAVGGASDIAGFYVSRATGSIAVVPRTAGRRRDELNAESIFFHEYAHHLMYQQLDVVYPTWTSEGFAEFFTTARFRKGGGVELGNPAEHRTVGLFLLGKPPIEELVGNNFSQKTSEARELLYARGWLLTHYLTFDPARKGQHSAYLNAMRRGVAPLEAAREAFGDLRQLDRDVDKYLRRNRFTYLHVDGPPLHENVRSIAIRPLRPGEAAILPTRIRSDRGVNKKTAKLVVADARKVGAAFPADPFVQGVLAEAELDAGDHAAAIVAADRALAVKPDDMQALIYKARSLMAKAEKGATPADWKAIRDLLSRANRLDKENPEPLILFHQSFAEAGEKPTANALEGLLYALVLAPHDGQLRYSVARELLARGRLDDAKPVVAPIAFNPHANEEARERGRKIVAAIGARNAAEALRLLDAEVEATTDE